MPNGSMESQIPAWKYTQMKNQNPGWSQNQIESSYRNSISTAQPTMALGGPIKQFGYQNPNGPFGGVGAGGAGQSGAGSQWYEGVLKGDNLPYSPFAIKNLESQATDMNAAGEAARNEQMVGQAAASGASASDPSLQGAKLNSMARRQTDNTQSVNDIQSKANQANFAAQAEAAARMTQMKLAYDEMANSNAMRFSPFGGGGGGGGRVQQGNRDGFLTMRGNSQQPLAQTQRNEPYGNRLNSNPKPVATAPQGTGNGQLNVADVWDMPRKPTPGFWAGRPGTPRQPLPPGTAN